MSDQPEVATTDNAERPHEPCGAWIVTEFIQGHEATMTWCQRTDGPCPFPGASISRTSQRPRACGSGEADRG